MAKVVITEGIIGAGKTTFSERLAHHLDAQWLREPDEKKGNPYLSSFYEDQNRWAFTMQLHLLNTRYRMHQHAQWSSMQGTSTVLDRSYFGDTAFARLQRNNGTMSETEYNTYSLCYHNMTASVLLPHVCVHLKVAPSVAQGRVSKRMTLETGRQCESVIDIGYLESLATEEQNMVDTLAKQGVHVIEIDYNANLSNNDIDEEAKKIAQRINEYNTPDLLLDFHRKTC